MILQISINQLLDEFNITFVQKLQLIIVSQMFYHHLGCFLMSPFFIQTVGGKQCGVGENAKMKDWE